MIPSTELAAMQAASNSAMDTAITIQRATDISDGTGHYSQTWGTVATVNGSVAQPTANQMQSYDYKIGSLAAWQIRIPVGTNVLENDRLIINGETMVVQVLMSPRSYEITRMLLASEVK